MRAIVVHQYGGPEVLKLEDYPDPVPGPGEVLVRVAAASVNPIDYKRRAGLTKDFYPMHFPGLIGIDMARTVVKIGPGVEGFSAGDQVFAMAAQHLRRTLCRECGGVGEDPQGARFDSGGGAPAGDGDWQPAPFSYGSQRGTDGPEHGRAENNLNRPTWS
jgi:NADPH:quinone reductase-like Zn-dependent oxidoreductase